MGNYKVELTASAERQLKHLPKIELKRVVTALEMLAITPFPQGCRKLSGIANTFRVRVGNYRIIYEVLVETVVVKVLKIGHRKDVYR